MQYRQVIVRARHKKAHQDLSRFNHNVWYTSSQDLLKIFFYYAINNYKASANLTNAQLTFTQELLPSSSKWFCV